MLENEENMMKIEPSIPQITTFAPFSTARKILSDSTYI